MLWALFVLRIAVIFTTILEKLTDTVMTVKTMFSSNLHTACFDHYPFCR